MLRKTTLMAGLATLFISTPVQADEHKITVLPDAYFPETTYVPAGDTIVFVNETDGVLTVTALDQTWETEEFGIDQTESLAITAEMAKSFSMMTLPTKMVAPPSRVSATLAQHLWIRHLQLRLNHFTPHPSHANMT